MNELTKKIYNYLNVDEYQGKAIIPPPFAKITQGEFLEYVPEKSLKMSFPIKEEYNNPFGIMFGGFYGLFFDHAFGPFSGLVAKNPTTSLELNITYIKSLTAADEAVIVEVEVINKSKSFILLQAKAYSKKRDILVAAATTRMLILDR